MAIPDFQTIMLPLLKLTADQNEHQFHDLVETLAREFRLSEEERKILLPSGTAFLFDNRVGWARLYLVRADLLEKKGKGVIKITQRGSNVLMQKPAKLDSKFLEQYPEFIEFVRPSKRDRTSSSATQPVQISKQTPEEILEYTYEEMRHELANQLLTQVLNASPRFFERLVIDLLVKMGFGGSIKDAGKVVGASGDEGIDGVIKQDQLGLENIYVQAKKWQSVVGRPELMKFVGALKGQKASKGVFITTSRFSNDCIDYVSKVDSKVVLVDGEKLAEFMIDNHIGVSSVAKYEIQRVDSDYFVEE